MELSSELTLLLLLPPDSGVVVAIHIVHPTLLRIRERLVCVGDALEACLRIAALVLIGMVLSSELAVGSLDLLLRRRAPDAQLCIVVCGRGAKQQQQGEKQD
eukprot:scaffold26098_cov32-Tisochrysis_lutea.AAC.6